jgi:Protein of unknown function (DUF5818)
MKKVVVLVMLVFALSLVAMAAEWTGYIADSNCAAKQGAAKVGSDDHAKCAAKCIKGGAAAVLVTPDGKIYKIENQDAVTDHAGHKVTITGKMTDDKIHVDNVKM